MKIFFVYLVKIHYVYNYRNYHEFGKQDCMFTYVCVGHVVPEPTDPTLRPPRCLRLGEKVGCSWKSWHWASFREIVLLISQDRILLWRVHVLFLLSLLNDNPPVLTEHPPLEAALAFPSLRIHRAFGLDVGETTPLLWASVSVSGKRYPRSRTSTTLWFLIV